MKWLIFIFLIAVACTPQSGTRYEMRSLLKCIPISDDYVLCDSSVTGEDNCYLRYAGKRYLKKERINFNENGTLKGVDIFKAEGVVQYSLSEINADSSLRLVNNWKIGSTLIAQRDSIVAPYKALMLENILSKQLIYATLEINNQPWLFITSYAKR